MKNSNATAKTKVHKKYFIQAAFASICALIANSYCTRLLAEGSPYQLTHTITHLMSIDVLILGIAFSIYHYVHERIEALRKPLFLATTFFFILSVSLIISSNALWRQTGSALTFDLITYGLQEAGKIAKIANSGLKFAEMADILVFTASFFVLFTIRIKLSHGKFIAASAATIGTLFTAPLIVNYYFFMFDNQEKTTAASNGYFASLFLTPDMTPLGVKLIKTDDKTTIYQKPIPLNAKKTEGNKNIILIILESTRADMVKKETMPFLSNLAEQSLQFTDVSTTTDHTSKALVGILCGMYPNPQTAISEATDLNFNLNCLPNILHYAGYRSLFIQSADGSFEQRTDLVKNFGFKEWKTREDLDSKKYKYVGYFGMDDNAMIAPAISWATKAKAPFFLTILTSVTHHPYTKPGANHLETNPINFNYYDPNSRTKAKKDYIETIKFSDDFLRNFYTALDKNDLTRDSIIIITGDHGEAFAEHGFMTHNSIPYHEVTKVPLVIIGDERKGLIHEKRQHLDILPYILEKSEITWQGKTPGISLSKSRNGTPIYTNCWNKNKCLSYTSGNIKYIYHMGMKNPEAYDTLSDPGEAKNIIDTLPDDQRKKATVEFISIKQAIDRFWGTSD